jgi:hypothetical protein
VCSSDLFNIILAAAFGYAIGEGISLSVNRKSGAGLMIVGALAFILSYVISVFTLWGRSFHAFDILALIIGVFVTVMRLR